MTTRHALRGLALMAALLLLPQVVHAGPPLICQAFEPAPGAALLPWGDSAIGWNTPDPTYDRQRLVDDTLRLLTPDAPILARMENLRRATIYAAADPRVAVALSAALQARTGNTAAPARQRALALFDAGVQIESYRQASQALKWDMLTGEARRAWAIDREPAKDGYPLVRQAIALAQADAAMQFAASIMTTGETAAAHHRRAVAMAHGDAVLAKHLAGR